MKITATFIITLQAVQQAISDVQMDSAFQQPCVVMVCLMIAQMEVMNLAAVSFPIMYISSDVLLHIMSDFAVMHCVII